MINKIKYLKASLRGIFLPVVASFRSSSPLAGYSRFAIINLLYYSLFFITPLLMASFTSELFEFNKMMFIYLTTIGVVFFWSVKMILTKKIIIKKTAFDLPILFFFGSQILSTLFSLDRHTSLFGYYGRFNGGLLSTLCFIVLYYGFVSNVPAGEQVLQKVFKISLFSSFLVILWGIPGKLGHDLSCLLFMGQFNNSCWTDQFRPAERIFSTLGQPNWLGAYLAINFFIGIYFFLKQFVPKIKEQKDSTKIKSYLALNSVILFSYLILNFLAILFTRSRSALFAVLVSLVIVLTYVIFLIKSRLIQPLARMSFTILLIFLFLAVVLFKTGVSKVDKFLSPSTYYKAAVSTFESVGRKIQRNKANQTVEKAVSSGVTTSSDIRKIVWKGALDLGLRYPLFGSGVETFAYSYYFVRPKEHNLTSEWDYLYNKAHNEYLNYLATTGFLGLGTYLVFIAFIFIYSWAKLKSQNSKLKTETQNLKTKKVLAISEPDLRSGILHLSLLLAWITILITNFFGFSTTTINLFFYLIPAFLVVLYKKQSGEKIESQQFSLFKISRLHKIMLLTLTLTYVFMLVYLIKYYLADINYALGENYSKLGEYQKAAQLLNDANQLKYEHVYEDKLSYVLANLAFIASYQKENDLASEMIQNSNSLNIKTLKAAPQNVLYWKTRAKNYYLYYQINLKAEDLNTAIEALIEARKISLTDPKIPYSLAIFYSLLTDEAKEMEKKQTFQRLALQEVERSISLKEDYRDGYFLKGQILKKTGKLDEAKNVLNYILQNLNSQDSEVKKELESL